MLSEFANNQNIVQQQLKVFFLALCHRLLLLESIYLKGQYRYSGLIITVGDISRDIGVNSNVSRLSKNEVTVEV